MNNWRADLLRREVLLDGVRTILVDVLQLSQEPDELDPDTPLFGAGLRVDSIDVLDLVTRIEGQYGVRVVEPGAAGPGALRTLNTIVDHLVAFEATSS